MLNLVESIRKFKKYTDSNTVLQPAKEYMYKVSGNFGFSSTVTQKGKLLFQQWNFCLGLKET